MNKCNLGVKADEYHPACLKTIMKNPPVMESNDNWNGKCKHGKLLCPWFDSSL